MEKKKTSEPNDLLARLIGVPAIAVVVSLLPADPNFAVSFWKQVIIAVIITILVWELNRFIVIYFRNRFPSISETWKRILVQFAVGLLSSAILMVIACKLICYLLFSVAPSQNLILANLFTGITLTFIITIIYECVYFFQQWRIAIVEAEELKRQHLHSQLETLKSQVNPHFLFNSLNTLTALIEENPNQAVDFVQQLSQVYRYILASRDQRTVSLREEIGFIRSYIFLLKMRFNENLQVKIDIPETHYNRHVPPLVLQLLVENAIKHNIISREHPLEVNIHVPDLDKLIVENPKLPKTTVEASSGFGLDNIISRYRLLGDEEVKIDRHGPVFRVVLPLI